MELKRLKVLKDIIIVLQEGESGRNLNGGDYDVVANPVVDKDGKLVSFWVSSSYEGGCDPVTGSYNSYEHEDLDESFRAESLNSIKPYLMTKFYDDPNLVLWGFKVSESPFGEGEWIILHKLNEHQRMLYFTAHKEEIGIKILVDKFSYLETFKNGLEVYESDREFVAWIK